MTSRARVGAADEKAYMVNLWESHPDNGNDDCSTGRDFDTLEEARACIANFDAHFNPIYYRDTPFIELDGPDVHEVIQRPGVKVRKKEDVDREWQKEQAMEAGMLHGTEGYNEVMGCEVEYYE